MENSPCWNTIGVWSKEVPCCSELAKVIHCRNCPVFIKRGRELFKRPSSMEYRAEWTELLTRNKEVHLTKLEATTFLIFRLEANWFGLEACLFKEIVLTKAIRPIPNRTNSIFIGIVNVHGQLQLTASLTGLMGIATTQIQNNNARLAIIEYQNQTWAFHADEIAGVEQIEKQQINLPPIHSEKGTYLQGITCWKHPHKEKVSLGILAKERLFEALARSLYL